MAIFSALIIYFLTIDDSLNALASNQSSTVGTGSNMTNNFKVYNNATLGIKINYPSNWTIYHQDHQVFFVSPFDSPSDRYQEKVRVFPQNVSGKYTLSQHTSGTINQYIDNYVIPGISRVTFYDINFGKTGKDGNLNASKLSLYIDPYQIEDVRILNKETLYTIYYYAYPEDYKKYVPTVQAMLRSLELTK